MKLRGQKLLLLMSGESMSNDLVHQEGGGLAGLTYRQMVEPKGNDTSPRGPGKLDRKQLHADEKIITLWLHSRGSRSKNTFEAYRREASRFMNYLWERGSSLRGVTVSDIHGYLCVLADPPAHWIAGEGLLYQMKMRGGLAPSSIIHSRRILHQMFGYLKDSGYNDLNVVSLSRRVAKPPGEKKNRFISYDAWRAMWQYICSREASGSYKRSLHAHERWLVAVLYHSGMRRSEAAASMMSDFHCDDGQWTLRVFGKGAKTRFVTVNTAWLDELVRYRRFHNLTPYPSANEESLPTIMRVKTGAQLSRSQNINPSSIYRSLKRVISEAISESPCPDTIKILESVTPQMLRHTHASHRMLAGAALETTQDELGHARLETTRGYSHTEKQKRVIDAEKLAGLSSV